MAMTPNTTYTYTDDLTGKTVSEEEYRTVEFSYGGDHYTIDLGADSTEKLDEFLAPYIDKAKKDYSKYHARPKKSGGKKNGRTPEELAKIREWAKSAGYSVADRGRISQVIQDNYDAAQGGK